MARPSAFSMLELELRKAMAESLGRAGERLENAIARYRLLDAGPRSTEEQLVQREAARREVIRAREWLIIQREAMGIRRHEVVDQSYPLPPALRQVS